MICRLCKEGVTKNGIAWHYREHHKNLPGCICTGIVKYSNNFNLCEMNELQCRNTIIPRIEELAVTEGIRCLYDGCNYVCIEPRAIKDHHCRLHHGWVVSKGIMLRYPFFLTFCIGVIWAAYDVQTLFKGNIRKYFPVRTTPLLDDADLDNFL